MEHRKIKFKAKRLDNGEWVEGYYVKYIGMENVKDKEKHLIFGMTKAGTTYWYEVDPSTVCQFTGLKDKNGKDVWEHDILIQVAELEVVFLDGSFQVINNIERIPMNELGITDNFLELWKNLGSKFDRKEGEK